MGSPLVEMIVNISVEGYEGEGWKKFSGDVAGENKF